jgi:hypothetical protein
LLNLRFTVWEKYGLPFVVRKLLFSIIILPVSLTLLLLIMKLFNFLFGNFSLFNVKQSSLEIKRICLLSLFLTLNLTISKEFDVIASK